MNVSSIFVTLGLSVEGFSKGESAIKNLGKMAQRYIAGTAVDGLVKMATEAAKAGTEILSLSKQLGISTTATQEWSYVAKTSGSNAKEFTTAIGQLERGLLQLSHGKGSKEARAAFLDLGISQAEAAKLMTKPDGLNEALFKISDRAKAMGNDVKRSAEIMMIAGRRAKGFAADMAQGSGALREQIKHVHAIGGVLDHGQLNNLKVFQNSINDLSTSFHALVMQAVASLAPELTKALNALTRWIGNNRKLITDTLIGAFHLLVGALKAVGEVIVFLTHHTTAVKAVMLALAAIRFGGIVSSLVGVIAKLFETKAAAAGAAAAAGPKGLGGAFGGLAGQVAIIGAGIVAWGIAISAAKELAENFTAGEIGQGLSDLAHGRSAAENSARKEDEYGDAHVEGMWKLAQAEKARRAATAKGGVVFNGKTYMPDKAAAALGKHSNKPAVAGGGSKHVDIKIDAPLTIHGVKGAESAAGAIRDAHEKQLRDAAASLGAEVK